jgi:hypothetical protein
MAESAIKIDADDRKNCSRRGIAALARTRSVAMAHVRDETCRSTPRRTPKQRAGSRSGRSVTGRHGGQPASGDAANRLAFARPPRGPRHGCRRVLSACDVLGTNARHRDVTRRPSRASRRAPPDVRGDPASEPCRRAKPDNLPNAGHRRRRARYGSQRTA